MQRRRYLAVAGASMTALGLAGCSEEEGGGENNSTNGTDAGPDTEELAETAEPTATATTEPPADETTMTATEAETDTETMIQTETPTSAETETDTETETETMMETEGRTVTNPVTPPTQGGLSETFSGSGQSTVEGLEVVPGPITAAFTADSEAYHTVTLIAPEGGSFDDILLVSGAFSGEGRQVTTAEEGGEHDLDVNTRAEWELAIEQPTNPEPESLPVDMSGSGYDYAGPFAFDGETTFQATHDGERNFIVQAIPLDPSRIATDVFYETEQFDGETTERVDAPAYLNVRADGEWSVSTG
jgi:hypothetical protein